MKCFNNIIILIALLVFSILFFTTCKKYPENDRIYLSTVKHRLTSHPWFFNSLLVNGIDSTYQHAMKFDKVYGKPSSLVIKFDKTLKKITVFFPDAKIGYTDRSMELLNKKKQIKIFESCKTCNSNGLFVFAINSDNEWDIKKLTNSECIVETNFNGNLYRFEFVK